MHVVLRPRYSGAETLVKALVPLHLGEGCRVAFCSLLPSEEVFLPEIKSMQEHGCDLYVPDQELRGWQRIRHVMKAIRAFEPEFIVAHSVIPAAYARVAAFLSGWRLKRNEQHRIAIAMHSASNDDYADEGGVFLRSEKVLTHLTDTVITVSDLALANYTKRVRPHPRLMRISNGIDLSRFQQAASRRSEIRTQLGLDGLKLAIQVGRLTHVKQQVLSFKALLPLLKARPNLRLWFAGLTEDPAYETELRALIADSGLSSQIELLGSRTDVPELLSAADLYLMPSTMEAHSVAMIEALASGSPVIASDIATFLYTQDLPGVTLIGVHDQEAMTAAAGRYLGEDSRYERDLSSYDIQTTERLYREQAWRGY
jgi:L-malate glycosyltransferase